MPPALSDDEQKSASEDEIPFRGKAAAADDVEVDEDEEGEEDDEEEFVVEKILSHKFDKKGNLLFDVKWQGYEEVEDRTWEPEDNLEGAQDVLQDYYNSIGGRPEPPERQGKKRKGRKPATVDSELVAPVATNKRAKKEKAWEPPAGSWEDDIDFIETIDEKEDPISGKPERFAYVAWKQEKKTQHPLRTLYHKAPQQMLKYYESHLVFTFNGTNDDADMNGEFTVPNEPDEP